jgi:hypothetical protein
MRKTRRMEFSNSSVPVCQLRSAARSHFCAGQDLRGHRRPPADCRVRLCAPWTRPSIFQYSEHLRTQFSPLQNSVFQSSKSRSVNKQHANITNAVAHLYFVWNCSIVPLCSIMVTKSYEFSGCGHEANCSMNFTRPSQTHQRMRTMTMTAAMKF